MFIDAPANTKLPAMFYEATVLVVVAVVVASNTFTVYADVFVTSYYTAFMVVVKVYDIYDYNTKQP